jgi:hypothetical protein
MPGLSLVLWSEIILKKVGNSIGYFVASEEGWLKLEDKIIAKILVKLDLHEGLL